MKRIAILASIVVLLLLGTVTLAQTGGHGPSTWYVVGQGAASGEGYHLTSIGWDVSGTTSGGGYHLLPASPALRGDGCCCTYVPCVLRDY